MSIKINEETLKKAINAWGVNAQIKMMREECLELSVEISKFFDRDNTPERFERVIDEIADVTIMSRQMALLPGIEEKIQKRVDFKIARLERRIEDKNYKLCQ